MKSTLTIKDLSSAKKLDGKAMSAVRGGTGDQANATEQKNFLTLMAPVAVGNGSAIGGGPINFQVTSNPIQTGTNTNTSTNDRSLDWHLGFPA